MPLRMTIGSMLVDPATSIADFSDLGDSGDVVSHTASYRRLLIATLAYHAVRAARRQHGLALFGRALSIARAVAAA